MRMLRRVGCWMIGLAVLMTMRAAAQQQPIPLGPAHGTTGPGARSLRVALELPHAQTNGVAISPDGRIFLVIPRQKGEPVPAVAEYVKGADGKPQLKPFPDAGWNGWKAGDDASHAFVHANSIRFGPDGTLWVVDFGSEELGATDVKHGPKLVGMNIATGKVVETLYLDGVTHPESAVDDVRFNGNHAYLTDAGWPGIIVVHLPDGHAYRTLTGNTDTVRAMVPLHGDNHQLQDKHGKPVYFHADQLEVSPDGKLLYYQPNSGPMAVIETEYLDDETLPDTERAKHARPFAKTGTAGGTAIDRAGNLFVSDCDHNAILKITPGGRTTLLVQDPRLIWADAMWISADGKLWIPAAQMDRTPSFNDGKMTVTYPVEVFTVDVGNGPPANDHR